VHGDDFLAAGSASSLSRFERTLLTTFEGKVKGRLQKPGDELRILNRIARRTEDGYEWEADQRHAEMIVASAGLDGESRPLTNPGRKLAGKEIDDEPELLNAEAASEYRARAARANFLASDRPDIAFAVKELCRGMSAPTARDREALKRLARYLLGKPRVVFQYARQCARRVHGQRLGRLREDKKIDDRRGADARASRLEDVEPYPGHDCSLQRGGRADRGREGRR
jgi:hypothetical protein